MSTTVEFTSSSGRPVCDEIRIDAIRKELNDMAARQEKMHEMDSNPHLLNCIYEVIEILDQYCDYDPTPDCSGEPPLTMAEMHTAAWQEHQRLHS